MKEVYTVIFLFISIILFIFSGLVQALFKEKSKANIFTFFSGIATVLGLIPTTIAIFQLPQNEILSKAIDFKGLIGNVNFVLDPLAAFFTLIILIIGLLAIIYSKKYLEPYGKSLSAHYFFLGIFIPSMILVVTVQNILFFLICWEIMSLASFFLLLFDNEKKEVRQTAINYLIMMQVGVLFLLSGFIFLNLKTGSLDFASFQGHISNTVFILLMIGFGIKAGFVPLHSWLPKAHPVAPSHISAIMSGVMIKTGIYGILRILTFTEVPSSLISYLVLSIGILCAFFGILYAIAQRDYKKMLAYSSIENIGLITISLGVAMLGLSYHSNIVASLGFLGVFAHILNHAIFKPLLFFAAGSIDSKVHIKDSEQLGGLIKFMPYTASLFLVGSLAICAMPPFNGFISELFIYLAMLSGLSTGNHFLFPILIMVIGLLAFVGAMVLIAFANMFSTIFLGLARSEKALNVEEDSHWSMLMPIGFLAGISLFIGLFPQYFMQIVINPCNQFLKSPLNFPAHILSDISIFNLTLLIVISIILLARKALLRNKVITTNKTWGCGYDKPASKMQYSNYSFSRPFLGFLTPFFIRELDFKMIKDLFPPKTHFKSRTLDIFEFYLIKPIIEFGKLIIKKFYWVQSGNVQKYLLYGLIFLLLGIIWTVNL